MSFTCKNEVLISGGKAEDRGRIATLLAAGESVDEDSLSRMEGQDALVLRFESVDGMPEEELSSLAEQFPGLSIVLVYFSRDGEFYGYARAGAGVSSAESADLEEPDIDEVGSRYDGDGLAFVRARYGLGR